MQTGIQSVKRRLSVINIVIIITSILGVLTIFEVSKGVRLHESNFEHLSLSSKLIQRLHDIDLSSKQELDSLESLLIKIKSEPEGCLASVNFFVAGGLKLLGTYGIVEICETDIQIAVRALEITKLLQTDQFDIDEASAEIGQIADQFHHHSMVFRPLVGKTTDALLILAAIIMVIKGVLIFLVTRSSSKSILQQFNHAKRMEKAVLEKNLALEESIGRLESQKEEIAKAQQSAERNALHDALTELPNRRFLDQKLFSLLEDKCRTAVLHIDVDRFKNINDTKGHDAGDYILVHVAKTLRSLVGEQDFVARIGGDEFVVLCCLEGSDDDTTVATELGEMIVETLNTPIVYKGFDCRLSVSVGIAIQDLEVGKDIEDYKKLLINADVALYRSKMNGRNRYDFFDANLKNELIHKKSLSNEVLEALDKDEFEPFYQLQFCAQSLSITGVEALARWHHPKRGILAPGAFLPVAEELGVIGDIDRRIMEQTWHDFSFWKRVGIPVPKFSVNVSLKRLSDPKLIESIKNLNFPAGEVSFEILESIFLDNTDYQIQWTIDTLREMGIDLELDDFGSGHASIVGLLELQPARFKIDRQLIGRVHESRRQKSLVKSIIDIGKSLNMGVIAEGVETAEHVEILRDFGCDVLQGYFLAKPMSKEDLETYIKAQSWKMAI